MASEIDSVEVIGNEPTRKAAVEDLLPRPLPADLTEAEIQEFSRRVKNLGIFDAVKVSREGNKLKAELRRKGTLTPLVGFSTGKTLEDSSLTAGLQDYDFDGAGTRAGGKISYAERGLNFALWIDEHTYSPNRWANEYEIYRLSSGFRFDGDGNRWSRNRLGGFAEWVSPFRYANSHLLHEFQLMTYHESFSNKVGTLGLRDALYFGGLYELIYDRYKWDDLVPEGYKLVLEFRPGMMTTGKFRGETRFKWLTALRIADQTTLVMNGNSAAVNAGDVNHSLLIGSQQGVRGLRDSFHRAAFVHFVNAEVRHAIALGPRLFLQPVLFADAASFRPMTSSGALSPWTQALSSGVGCRLVPTAYTNLLLRADVTRMHLPEAGWAVLFGITQYF